MRGSGPLTERYVAAVRLAERTHHAQFRKGTHIAYLSHVMSVSALVLEDGGSEDEAIAGLLHDAIEDGRPPPKDEIRERFGHEVLVMVLACSDDEPAADGVKRPWLERKEAYVAHLESARSAQGDGR